MNVDNEIFCIYPLDSSSEDLSVTPDSNIENGVTIVNNNEAVLETPVEFFPPAEEQKQAATSFEHLMEEEKRKKMAVSIASDDEILSGELAMTNSSGAGGNKKPPINIAAAAPEPELPPEDDNLYLLEEPMEFFEPTEEQLEEHRRYERLFEDDTQKGEADDAAKKAYDTMQSQHQITEHHVQPSLPYDNSTYNANTAIIPASPPPVSEIESVTGEIIYSPLYPLQQPPAMGLSLPGANVFLNPIFQQPQPMPINALGTPDFYVARRQSPEALTEKSSERPSAYDMAHELMRMYSFKVVGDNIFAHNETHYQRLPERALKRIIMETFRPIFQAGASSQFRREIREAILDEPQLAQKMLRPSQELVSFQNGVVSLITGELLKHDPKWITTYCLQCNYVPGIPQPPCFSKFLADITGSDGFLIDRIWQTLGYILSPDTQGKVFFLLQGVPDSGKSVFSSLLRSFFNEEALISLDVHDFADKFAASELIGKALCISPDLPSAVLDSRSVSKIKQFTGGDNVTADQKFKSRVSFYCTAKFVLATNHALLFKGDDSAFMNRAVVIPFKFSTPKELQDRCLLKRLQMELDAIATYAIQAYRGLVANNYVFSGNYFLNEIVATDVYSEDLDSNIFNFVLANYEKDDESFVLVADAQKLFEAQFTAVSSQQFSPCFVQIAQELFETKAVRTRNGYPNARKFVKGLRLKDVPKELE